MFWHRRVITLFPYLLQFLSCLFEKHFGNSLANFYPLSWEKTPKQKSLPNPGVDIILNTVHQFTPRCKCKKEPCECGTASGDVDFAKKGFTGASKQWNCAVFGSVAFLALQGKWRRYRRNIPPNWPSGVYWNQGNKSRKNWCYKDNPIEPKDTFGVSIKEGRAEVRIYNIEVILKYYRYPNSR
jgi:hypothetical protein